jgi:hypothetical protein
MQFGSIFTQDRKKDVDFLQTPENLEEILANQNSAAKSMSDMNPLAKSATMSDKFQD